LAGWWGTDKHERFQFKKDFNAVPTAEGWQLSNAPVLSMAVHKAALDIFEEAGFENILAKGKKLSAYLLFILNEINKNLQENVLQIITPQSENKHGCQVSIAMLKNGKEVFEALNKNSVIADRRESDVIRIAPVPLYNTFEEVFLFGQTIKNYFKTREKAIS